jgi:hypothetical protein
VGLELEPLLDPGELLEGEDAGDGVPGLEPPPPPPQADTKTLAVTMKVNP